MEITKTEESIIAVTRLNKMFPEKSVHKQGSIGKLKITFSMKSANNLWGRFGGGWNWKLGFQAGGRTLIISLLVFDIYFYIKA